MPHTGLYLPPKALNSTVPLHSCSGHLLHPPCDSYQPACVLKLLWMHRGPWGFGQVLYCAACLEEEPT